MPADKPEHNQVAVIRRAGLVGIITERVVNGVSRFSYAILKEYDKNGETMRTHWLERRHIDTLRDLTDEVAVTLDKLEDKARTARRERAAR